MVRDLFEQYTRNTLKIKDLFEQYTQDKEIINIIYLKYKIYEGNTFKIYLKCNNLQTKSDFNLKLKDYFLIFVHRGHHFLIMQILHIMVITSKGLLELFTPL